MAGYESRRGAVTSQPSGVLYSIFQANAQRVCLVVSAIDTAGIVDQFFLHSINNLSFPLIAFECPGCIVLPYRDYGPIIRDAVFIQPKQATQIITVTEIWLVGSQ
jgi:hypothetical protein